MIRFEDFRPRVLQPGGVFRVAQYESLTQVVQAADRWVRERGVRIISIETVLLPNLEDRDYASHAGNIRTSGESSSYWFQIVRVWYEVEEEA